MGNEWNMNETWMNENFLSIYLSCHLSLSLSPPQRWTPLGGGWSHSRHHPPPRNALQCTSSLSRFNPITFISIINNQHSIHNPITPCLSFIIIIVLNPNPKTYNTFWRPLRRPPFGDGVEEWCAAVWCARGSHVMICGGNVRVMTTT